MKRKLAMNLGFHEYLLLTLLWCLYFLMHSLLASLGLKQAVYKRLPGFMPYYRIGFNLIAVLLLIPPLYFMYRNPGATLWSWDGGIRWLQHGIALAVVLLFFWSLRYYDGKEFLGVRQILNRTRSPEDQERFYISPAHRLVRHPWYTLALILLWSRDMHESFLATTVLITLYFMIGSRMEERKLMVYHGDAYRAYRKRVCGLFPLPGKILSRQEADQIIASANGKQINDPQ